jgi:hypothetical protein
MRATLLLVCLAVAAADDREWLLNPRALARRPVAETWSWHVFDFSILKTSKVEAVLHTRVRTGRALGNPQQGRTGAILKLNAGAAFSIVSGYYYGREEDSAEDWRNFHRVFSGVEAPVYRNGPATVAVRGLLERFFVDDRPGFFGTASACAFRRTVASDHTPAASGFWTGPGC